MDFSSNGEGLFLPEILRNLKLAALHWRAIATPDEAGFFKTLFVGAEVGKQTAAEFTVG